LQPFAPVVRFIIFYMQVIIKLNKSMCFVCVLIGGQYSPGTVQQEING
jgi:hypothetical protein